MRPVSAAFLRALRGSHKMRVQAWAVSGFQTGVNPAGTELFVIDGDVTLDAAAAIRSTAEVTVTGSWPSIATDPLAPYGQEIFLRRGVELGDGAVEWVSLGYHRIQTPEQDNPPDGPIRIAAQDRMAGIIDAKLLTPRTYPAGTLFGAIVDDLVLEIYPSATIEWDDDSDTLPTARAITLEDDRYSFLATLVESAAKIFYWDHRGILVIRSLPDPAHPVYGVDAGADGVLVAMSRRLTRDGVVNVVVVTGQAPFDELPPVYQVAFDDDPASATYFHGPFGQVPMFFDSPLLTTDVAAAAAADTLLRKHLGLVYNLDFTTIVNPALEPYDPVSVTYPTIRRSADMVTETHIIDRVTIPLTAAAAMAATTREQTVVLIGTVVSS